MKVRELIAELAKHDPEMEVFLYNEMEEGDSPITFITELGTHLYCKGDSFVEEFLATHPGHKALVIHDDPYVYTDDGNIHPYYDRFEFKGIWERVDEDDELEDDE